MTRRDWEGNGMTELEKAATEMLNCVDGMLAHGEWYAAQEKADNLRAILTWAEPVVLTGVDPISGFTFKATLKFDPEPVADPTEGNPSY